MLCLRLPGALVALVVAVAVLVEHLLAAMETVVLVVPVDRVVLATVEAVEVVATRLTSTTS